MRLHDDKPGWRSMGVLRAAPELVAPGVLLAVCIASYVADGDPFSRDAGMFFAGAGIVVALLLLVPPLLAGLLDLTEQAMRPVAESGRPPSSDGLSSA